MKEISHKAPPHYSEKLWDGANSPGRSSWLTPLYVERFAGPRKSAVNYPHDFWEFICISKGEGRFVSEESFPIRRFDIVLVPKGVVHGEISESVMDTIWIGFTGRATENCRIDKPVCMRSEELSVLIEKLWFYTQRKAPLAGPVFDARILEIFALFLKTLHDGGSVSVDKVEAAVKYINENFARNLCISDIAAKFAYSEGHFYRLFKKRVGSSPADYLTSVRLKHAANWLQHTDIPIAKVATNSGFADQAYFSRVFSRYFGTSPGRYRKMIH